MAYVTLNRKQVEKLAHKLMKKWLYNYGRNWWFQFDSDVSPLIHAYCDLQNERIAFNSYFVGRLNSHEVYNTLLHEIAHAIRGTADNPHDEKWSDIFKTIGGNGKQYAHPIGRNGPDVKGKTWYQHAGEVMDTYMLDKSYLFDPLK